MSNATKRVMFTLSIVVGLFLVALGGGLIAHAQLHPSEGRPSYVLLFIILVLGVGLLFPHRLEQLAKAGLPFWNRNGGGPS